MWSQPDWDDGNYMEWADQERLVRQDLEEINKDLRRESMTQKFEIEETIAVLSERDSAGFRKELNYGSWNDRRPKYDIRGWSEDHKIPTKGITLTADELLKVAQAGLKKLGGK